MQCNGMEGFYARLTGEDLSLYLSIYIYAVYMVCIGLYPHMICLECYSMQGLFAIYLNGIYLYYSIYLSIYLSTYLSIYLSITSIYLSIYIYI